ncbi:MAG TPA: RNase J family beta-CASP ribonuclease [Candidatus Nanoarchaeia archaeon]|nr:RNase J family beta-CASP ribonuclease [Candidatus Nanoarchaeia archaeon]
MSIEVCTLGGFSDTGRNSTAIKIDDEVIILDMGLHMENYIQHTEDREDVSSKTYSELLKVQAVPDYGPIEDWKDKVKAIIPSHGHLDHMGAIPFAAPLFPKAPIICTPFTAEILRFTFADENIKIPNKLIPLNLNSVYKLTDKISVELVYMTHSIPHTSLVTLHTPYGKIVYANDYKIDLQPTLGQKPNFARLKKIGEEGVVLLVIESLYAHEHKKCPSESVARQMLKDTLFSINTESKAVIVTTFSSHLARLKSIIEIGRKLNRKIVFLGRSLHKYVMAGEKINLVQFTNEVQIIRHKDKINNFLRKIAKLGRDKYLIVCTGHQGEPKAILSRLVRDEFEFKFSSGDIVVFSCSVIPVELNKINREKLEQQLKNKKVRIFTDVHVSGHAAREDHRELIEMIKPKNIIPSHAPYEKAINIITLAQEMGYKTKNLHLMENGKRIVLK